MHAKLLISVFTAFALILGGCSMSDSGSPFPERDFNNHEVYPIMEQLVADTVTAFPDFPGFALRKGSFLNCEKEGKIYDDWVAIELRYTFSEENSNSEPVRTQYTDVLRDYWAEAGYEITRDEPNRSGTHYALEATVPGGIGLWWEVAGTVFLTVQTGCVPVGNGQRVTDYIPPAGGVTSENDLFGRNLNDAPTGVPEAGDEESDEAAVNPFDGLEAAAAPPGTNPFQGQL
jgi:hypothetical protein